MDIWIIFSVNLKILLVLLNPGVTAHLKRWEYGEVQGTVNSDSNKQMCLCPVELSKKQNEVYSIQLHERSLSGVPLIKSPWSSHGLVTAAQTLR